VAELVVVKGLTVVGVKELLLVMVEGWDLARVPHWTCTVLYWWLAALVTH
jgi:hypothetical protein